MEQGSRGTLSLVRPSGGCSLWKSPNPFCEPRYSLFSPQGPSSAPAFQLSVGFLRPFFGSVSHTHCSLHLPISTLGAVLCLGPWCEPFAASAGLTRHPSILPAPVLAWSAPWGRSRGREAQEQEENPRPLCSLSHKLRGGFLRNSLFVASSIRVFPPPWRAQL